MRPITHRRSVSARCPLPFLAATVVLSAGAAVSAQTLTPPDFLLGGEEWAYSPDYTQQLSGTQNIQGFRLMATAHPRIGPGAAWHSDIELKLTSPNGTVHIIGGDVQGWADPLIAGTPPVGNGELQQIDATYMHNLGPIEGVWSVNFYNTWTTGGLNWTNIQIVPLEFATGACCHPNGTCDHVTELNCTNSGGTYQGDHTDCATIPACPQPGACCFANGGCMVTGSGPCAAVGGTFSGHGTTCAAICPAPTDRLTPPNISVVAGEWAFPTPYTQGLTGTQNINAFRLVVEAQPATPTSTWQSDMQVELTSPGGTTLLIGGTATNWANALFAGTGPVGNGNPQSIDATYLHEFGPMEGTWAVNFRNNFSSGTLHWDSIQVVPLRLVSGACCMPDGTCDHDFEPRCVASGGIYQGDETNCATIPPCPQPGACCTDLGCLILSQGQCAAANGEYRGNGTACETAACPAAVRAVVPRTHVEVAGGTTLNIVLQTAPRTYQFIIAAAELSGLSAGQEITGLSWRLPAGATIGSWPPADAQYTRFDVEVATAVNTPATMSTTYADNIGPDALMVREGPLTIPAMTFPGGAVAPAVNDFGQAIEFHTPFVYTGGDLVVTIRHEGHNATGRTVDTITSGAAGQAVGYGTLFRSQSSTNITSPTGATASFHVLMMTLGASQICFANCDGSTTEPILTVDDFTCFINEFAHAQGLPYQQQVTSYANCDGSTTEPVLTVDDFTCFINEFAAGCP